MHSQDYDSVIVNAPLRRMHRAGGRAGFRVAPFRALKLGAVAVLEAIGNTPLAERSRSARRCR